MFAIRRLANMRNCISNNLDRFWLNSTPLRHFNGPTQATSVTSPNIIANIDEQIKSNDEGRLFAVVHLCGKQYKITAGDIILVEGYWPPSNGDQIRLEKVLLLGGKDFSLIGKPLLEPGLVDIKATIIEKTLTHTKTHFRKKRRKQYMRINFYRSPNSMIMINSINVFGPIDGNSEAQSKVDC